MSVGIALGGTTAGSLAVRASNPLPVYTPSGFGVQLTDGTRFADVVSEGTKNAAWAEGIILMGKDTAGTFYPVPLATGGSSSLLDINSNKLDTIPRVGQAKIATAGAAVQLDNKVLINGVIVTALFTNASAIALGTASVADTVDGTGDGYILEAGASSSFAVDNINRLYINGTAGDIVSFAGS